MLKETESVSSTCLDRTGGSGIGIFRKVAVCHAKRSSMSALGQKRTYAVQKVMSALPPLATAKATTSGAASPLDHPSLDYRQSEQQHYPERTGISM